MLDISRFLICCSPIVTSRRSALSVESTAIDITIDRMSTQSKLRILPGIFLASLLLVALAGCVVSVAPAWRKQLLGHLRRVELTLVLGQYAQAYHFGKSSRSLTDLVKSWRTHWPHTVPLPHPSPRNNLWLRRNPWFEAEVLPYLQKRVSELLNG